jgi:hypothetical protein
MSRVANIAYEASLAAYRGDDEYKQQARLTKSFFFFFFFDMDSSELRRAKRGATSVYNNSLSNHGGRGESAPIPSEQRSVGATPAQQSRPFG